MPEYLYCCDDCKYEFSIFAPMAEASLPRKCKKCKSKNTYRDYYNEKSRNFIPQTVGHLADINGDRMSQDQKDSIINRNKEKTDGG